MNIPNSLKALVKEVGEFEKEHRKYSEFYASWTLKITQAVLDEYAEDPAEHNDWLPFLDLTVVATGVWDDSYGSEINDWDVYREEAKQSKQASDFWSLMSHLNSEDNEMAHEFAAKYLPNEVKLVPVKSDLLAITVPAMSVAKAVADA